MDFSCHTPPTENRLRVRFLTPTLARIQIFPSTRPFQDTGLNRYHFIQEPPELPLEPTPLAPDGMAWKSDRLSVQWTEEGKLVCRDGAGNLLLQMTDLFLGHKAAQATFQAQEDEDWVGFCDQTRDHLYHRGHKAVCWVSNVSSYLPVPFFMSTKGYGVLVNTTHCVVFDMAKSQPDQFSWKDERAVVDFYLFVAPTFKDCLRQYTELTGRPKLPPEWSFGLWFICRTQANDAEVMENASRFRQEGIPCDVIGLEPGWMETYYDLSVEKDWSTQRFPLPEWLLKEKCEHTWTKALKRMGYHLELWLCNEYDLSYEEERKIQGEEAQREAGLEREEPTFHEVGELDLHFARPRYADAITKKEEPWFQHLKKFVDWGADFFKQDGAFQVCTHPDRVYGNGMLDAEMHNLYPLLYARQMWEGFAQYTHRRPVVFTASGWTGFQSWAGTWTGDVGGRLETLGSMLNTALMGHSWATNDMEIAEPEGIHFGYLLPWSQINSWTYFRMPWLQGGKLHRMHQDYARFRARLIPYLYSSAREATLTGLPLMKPLTLEFQEDRKCRGILHEYLLGRDLLVGIYKKETYLPQGAWKDFWTGKHYDGGQELTLEWPEEKGGNLLVRQGAVIPLGPLMQFRKEKPLDEIQLYLFPGETSSQGTLYEDDGVTFQYQKGEFALTTVTAQNLQGVVTVTTQTQGASAVKRWKLTVAAAEKPREILFNGTPLPFQWDEGRREATTL